MSRACPPETTPLQPVCAEPTKTRKILRDRTRRAGEVRRGRDISRVAGGQRPGLCRSASYRVRPDDGVRCRRARTRRPTQRHAFPWHASWALALVSLAAAIGGPIQAMVGRDPLPPGAIVVGVSATLASAALGAARIGRSIAVQPWGLVLTTRGTRRELPFDRIRSVRRRLLEFGGLQLLTVELGLSEGSPIVLRSWLWAPPAFLCAIEADVQHRHMDRVRSELANGYGVDFGRLRCNRRSVQLDAEPPILWSDLRQLRLLRAVGRERVEIVGARGEILQVAAHEVVNLGILAWVFMERGIPVSRELTLAVSRLEELGAIAHGMTGYRRG
jgi:hypothetical protein